MGLISTKYWSILKTLQQENNSASLRHRLLEAGRVFWKKKITLVLLCFPSGMCCWSSRLGWMVWPSWACCYLAGQTHHRHPKLATHLPFQPIKGKGKEKEYSGGTEGRMHRQPLERAGREAQFGMKHRGHGACWVHNRVRESILSEGVRMVARRTEESWADPDVLEDEKVSCRQLMK